MSNPTCTRTVRAHVLSDMQRLVLDGREVFFCRSCDWQYHSTSGDWVYVGTGALAGA